MALPQAPTVFTVAPKFYKSGYVTFTWSGAVAGDYPIAKYEIQYSSASDSRFDWDGWNSAEMIRTTNTYGTETSAMVNKIKLGCYTRYRVRTVDSMNNASAYKEADGYVQYGDPPPTAPTVFTAAPAEFSSGDVTLTWSGAKANAGSMAGYEFQYATSANGTAWGAWQAITYKTMSVLSGTYKTNKVNAAIGGYTRYQIRAKDSGSRYSDYAVSNSVKTVAPPLVAPTFNAPVTGGLTYNPRPRGLITLNCPVHELASGGNTASSTAGLTTGKKVVLRRTTALPNFSPTYSMNALVKDSTGNLTSAGVSYGYYKTAFADDAIIARETSISNRHIAQVRAAINDVLAYYGLPEKTWTLHVDTGSATVARWQEVVLEMRGAVQDIINLVNGWDTASTTHRITQPSWLAMDEHTPSAAVINQLRDIIIEL